MTKTLKVLVIPLWLITLAAVACMKKAVEESPHAEMRITNFHDLEIKANTHYHADLDGDGYADFTFHTQLVGDPVLKRDRLQFLVGSKIYTSLLNNNHDESPRLNKGDRIGAQHKEYNWFKISSIVLAEKVIPLNGEMYWDGIWKQATHDFLPVQISVDGRFYYGWIEISFDVQTEKMVLHKAGISTESDKDIKAGF